MNTGQAATIIGKSVKIRGEIAGSEDLVLDGELEGSIQLSAARLTIGPAARVRADVAAQHVVVFGKLEGDIRCPGRVELRSSAVMQGNIYAAGFSIEDNAAFRGTVDPSRANEPSPATSTAGAAREAEPKPAPAPVRATPLPAALAAAATRPLVPDSAGNSGNSKPAPAVLFADLKS